MNQIAIVYWSGTGNTEAMAQCIAEGVQDAGGQAQLLGPGEFSADRFSEFSAVAFGCSAMGAEQLEEDEVEPMFAGLEDSLGGKKIALFGSYGWRRPVDAGLVCPLRKCRGQSSGRRGPDRPRGARCPGPGGLPPAWPPAGRLVNLLIRTAQAVLV